ncbi:MAG: response regulator transcription factor [Ignavibacteriae bacterium]|nr:response regulator transcription factor [Ignavibacteriota bacterium]
MRILIVEDDQASMLVLSTYLTQFGAVSTAPDGEAGVEAFRTALAEGNPFQLVCLDIMMPKLDGQAALKQVRVIEKEFSIPAAKQVKVIMTTALGDRENLLEALPQCDAYLQKPVDRAQLLFYIKRFGLLKA